MRQKITLELPKAIMNQLNNADFGNLTPEVPKTPNLEPVTPMSEALTRTDIDRIKTTDLLANLIGDADFGNQNLDLKQLAGATPQHLARRFDLSLEDANRLAMLFEFAKRVACSHADREKITAPSDIASLLMPELRYLQQEVLVCMALDTKGGVTDNLLVAQDTETAENGLGNLISHRKLFEGTLNACVFHPREIFRYAIDCNANSIVIAHNHPSGDPQPSQEDIRATKQLIEAGDAIGIKVLDHIIIGDGIFVSLKEEGFI